MVDRSRKFVGLTVLSLVLLCTAPLPASATTCPCYIASPFFAAFIDGHRQLITCTNNTPQQNFVRLVADNFDLIVVFGYLDGERFCGWQPWDHFDGAYVLPVSADEETACKKLMTKAAAHQGVPCLRER